MYVGWVEDATSGSAGYTHIVDTHIYKHLVLEYTPTNDISMRIYVQLLREIDYAYTLMLSFKFVGVRSATDYKVNDARIQLINMSNNLNQFAYDEIN